jgi:putative oxidoreductase
MEKISAPAISNISELTRKGHARIGLSAALVNANAEPGMYIEFGWILLLARTVLAVVMIYYGWPKIRDLQATAHEFAQMGFYPPLFWGTLIALVEFVGGMAMLLGFFAELAASLFGFQMLVGTLWKLRVTKPFTDYSYDLQLFALSLVIMSQGAGILVPARFDGSILLRWDVAAAALASALLFAALCKPKLAGQEPLAIAK